jgi:UDP-N-acetylenolpyruvoylglucosamine reductase
LMAEQDNGDYRDQLYLLEMAQVKVKQQFWIDLIPEVQIIRNKDV